MIPGRRTAEGQLVITAGPPLSTDPRMAGFAMKPTGEIYASGGQSAFTPADLFLNGEQGVWYDPSDLTTMFQDRAGSTPVTADGQPVGLVLDKSKGLVLGSESCPAFTNSGWDDAGAIPAGWVLSGGILTVTASAQWARAASTLSQNALNKWFICSIDVQSISGTVNVSAWLGWTGGVSTTRSIAINTTGIKSFYFYSNDAAAGVDIQATTAGASFVFNSISVKEIAGNHAVAPSDAARPLYKTDGTYHWLQFDGVDDTLSTEAIDFTSTDKMSVFSGRYKASNAAIGLMYELSVNINSNNGSMYYSSPENVTGEERTASKGTTIATDIDPGIPTGKLVLSELRDISAPSVYNRRNGVTSTPTTSSQGTGNFGNYPLYIASRATTSTFFNGNIYSLIVRGALSTPDEVTETETWVNGKTGAY